MTSKVKKTKINFSNSKINIANKSSSIKKPIKITCIYAKKINNQKPKKKIGLTTNKSLKTTRLPYSQKTNNFNNEINVSKSTSIATSKPKIINVTWFKDLRQSLSKMNTSVTNDDNNSSFLNYDLGNVNNLIIEEEEENKFENLINDLKLDNNNINNKTFNKKNISKKNYNKSKDKGKKEYEIDFTSLNIKISENDYDRNLISKNFDNDMMYLETLDKSRNSSFYLSNIDELNLNEKINNVYNTKLIVSKK
jgi:hypothetical protein